MTSFNLEQGIRDVRHRSPPPAGRRRGGGRRSWRVPIAACADIASSETVEIQVAEGRLRGLRTGGVDAYKGVPYGASVSGAARFKPAKPVAPWSGSAGRHPKLGTSDAAGSEHRLWPERAARRARTAWS
jgi:hypothetical protein